MAWIVFPVPHFVCFLWFSIINLRISGYQAIYHCSVCYGFDGAAVAVGWVIGLSGDCCDLWCSSDTSRCVAEKKYTEQQAKKLFPPVFVPVCNPDGTYSEVTQNTPVILPIWEPHTINHIKKTSINNDLTLCGLFNDRFSVTATRDTAGVSLLTVDPSVVLLWPIRNLGAKVHTGLTNFKSPFNPSKLQLLGWHSKLFHFMRKVVQILSNRDCKLKQANREIPCLWEMCNRLSSGKVVSGWTDGLTARGLCCSRHGVLV